MYLYFEDMGGISFYSDSTIVQESAGVWKGTFMLRLILNLHFVLLLKKRPHNPSLSEYTWYKFTEPFVGCNFLGRYVTGFKLTSLSLSTWILGICQPPV